MPFFGMKAIMPDESNQQREPLQGQNLGDESAEDESRGDEALDGPVDRSREQLANGLIGGVSGGLMGLIVGGFIGSRLGPGLLSIAITMILTIALGIVVAMVNVQSKLPAQPVAPRAVWGVLLTGVALLIVLAVYLLEAAYAAVLRSDGQSVKLPLAIWPACRTALMASLVALVSGFAAALAGWSQVSENKGKYTGNKWLALSILASGAWLVLAFACYVAGYGFSLVL